MERGSHSLPCATQATPIIWNILSMPPWQSQVLGLKIDAPQGIGQNAEMSLASIADVLAAMPPGADAVVMVERARLSGDGQQVLIDERVALGQYVAVRGEDIRAGEVVLEAGTHPGPAQIAGSAAGAVSVKVCRRPRLAVLVAGDELVEPTAQPVGAQIRNSNGPCLLALDVGPGGQLVFGLPGNPASCYGCFVSLCSGRAGGPAGARDRTVAYHSGGSRSRPSGGGVAGGVHSSPLVGGRARPVAGKAHSLAGFRRSARLGAIQRFDRAGGGGGRGPGGQYRSGNSARVSSRRLRV